MATESQLVFKAILLASALHLSKLGKLPAFAVKPYRVAMQRSFRDSVKTQSAEWSLGATVLLSIIFDVSTPRILSLTKYSTEICRLSVLALINGAQSFLGAASCWNGHYQL